MTVDIQAAKFPRQRNAPTCNQGHHQVVALLGSGLSTEETRVSLSESASTLSKTQHILTRIGLTQLATRNQPHNPSQSVAGFVVPGARYFP